MADVPTDEQDPVQPQHEIPSGDHTDPVAEPVVQIVPDPGTDDFTGRTAAAEELPLAERADAFSALHDELRTRLETGGNTGA